MRRNFREIAESFVYNDLYTYNTKNDDDAERKELENIEAVFNFITKFSQTVRNQTIDECAKIADGFNIKGYRGGAPMIIEQAILALKDHHK